MPERAPKMYGFIFGFQRLVWCPKWTPASRSDFMERTAMYRLLSRDGLSRPSLAVAIAPPGLCPPLVGGGILRDSEGQPPDTRTQSVCISLGMLPGGAVL